MYYTLVAILPAGSHLEHTPSGRFSALECSFPLSGNSVFYVCLLLYQRDPLFSLLEDEVLPCVLSRRLLCVWANLLRNWAE